MTKERRGGEWKGEHKWKEWIVEEEGRKVGCRKQRGR